MSREIWESAKKLADDIAVNTKAHQQNIDDTTSVGAAALRPNNEYTQGSLKNAKLRRLARKTTNLKYLVETHTSEDAQALSARVNSSGFEEGKELLELLELLQDKTVQEAETRAKAWTESQVQVAELVEIWKDLMVVENGEPVKTIKEFLVPLNSTVKTTESKKILELLTIMKSKKI